MTEDQSMSGAQFRRHVGVDPNLWAQQFLAAYAMADAVRTDADRQAFVAHWFADAMDAAAGVAERYRFDLARGMEEARRDRDAGTAEP
jgi:hypothetical protein